MTRKLLPILLLLACNGIHPDGTQVYVENQRTDATTVYVSFSGTSVLTPADWTFCEGTGLTCSFQLDGKTTKQLPNKAHAYLNATFSFDAPVGCGATKAEVNVNNPDWYDILDVSLVDGYNEKLEISATPTGGKAVKIGPPVGKDGNEAVFGVFPYGCDICVARQDPPCDIPTGKSGCKKGTQYDPDVPCQWQGPVKGGGGDVTVSLL